MQHGVHVTIRFTSMADRTTNQRQCGTRVVKEEDVSFDKMLWGAPCERIVSFVRVWIREKIEIKGTVGASISDICFDIENIIREAYTSDG